MRYHYQALEKLLAAKFPDRPPFSVQTESGYLVNYPAPACVQDAGTFEGGPQQLATLIYDQLLCHPQHHWQNSWVGYNECGTTMCIAGYASFFADGQVNTERFTVMQRAATLLGLTQHDARSLFLCTSRPMVLRALEFLMKGDPIDWRAVAAEDPYYSGGMWDFQPGADDPWGRS